MVWTQPRASWRAWRRGEVPGAGPEPAVAWRVAPAWTPRFTGLVVSGAF